MLRYVGQRSRMCITVFFLAYFSAGAQVVHGEMPRCDAPNFELATQLTMTYRSALIDIQSSILNSSAVCTVKAEIWQGLDSPNLSDEAKEALAASGQAFQLQISGSAVTVFSSSAQGLLFGLSRLQQLVESNSISDTSTVEYPAIHTRGLHFVMRNVSYVDFVELIRLARRARFNTLIVQVADAVAFDTFPGDLRKDALSKAEFIQLVHLAKENGLDVIPEIKLLTHQEKFLQNKHPEWMFNKVTYDPGNAAVYDRVAVYLNELLDAINPTYVHIGHDEVKGFGKAAKRKWLEKGEGPLPAELFLHDTLQLYRIITNKGRKVMMWGDMLLGKQFVHEIFQRSWSERSAYASIVEKLPTDIIVVDWRYFDRGPQYPSVENLGRTGISVFGATWDDPDAIRAFSSYMAGQFPQNSGMIATTWNAVQRKEWPRVRKIAAESGDAFWYGR